LRDASPATTVDTLTSKVARFSSGDLGDDLCLLAARMR